MGEALKTILFMIVGILKIPLIFLVAVIVLFVGLVGANLLAGRFKGRKLKKGNHKSVKKKSVLHRLLIELPKRVSEDMLERDPDFFKYQGLIVYTGRQGQGKTISMIRDARLMSQEYPESVCMTNLGYKYQDFDLVHWKQLVSYKNGIYGIVAVMDELQNWFSSNQSKNFPPEMLQVITQNRKNRRVILGTAQNFYLLAKAIRSQCTEVRECHTYFGALTFVHRKEPVLDASGDVIEWKNRGWYFFVHDYELRDSYDTYRVIDSLVESGFKDDKAS